MTVIRKSSNTLEDLFSGRILEALSDALSEPKLDRLRLSYPYNVVKFKGIGGATLEKIESTLEAAGLSLLPWEGDNVTEDRLIEMYGSFDNVPALLFDLLWETNSAVSYILEELSTQCGEELSFGDLATFTRDQLESDIIDAYFVQRGPDESPDYIRNGLDAIEFYLVRMGLSLKRSHEFALAGQ